MNPRFLLFCLFPSLALAQSYSVSPSIAVTLDAPLAPPALSVPAHQFWQVNCSDSDPDVYDGWGAVEFHFASSPIEQVQDLSVGLGANGGEKGMGGGSAEVGPLPAGIAFFPRWPGVFCSGPLGSNLSAPVSVDGPPVVVPPFFQVPSVFNLQYTTYAVDQIPVGVGVVPELQVFAEPKGGESLTVQYQGAGVSFSRTVSQPTDIALDASWGLVATEPGPILVSVTFNPYGVVSNIVNLTAVAPAAPSPGSSANGAGNASTNHEPAGGCGATGCGPGLVALLGLIEALRRRRRA